MLSEIFEFITISLAVFFCAAAVKLADDYLDKEIDAHSGQPNWAEKLGSATLFYAIIFLIIAAGLHSSVSLPLFLASYIVGMFNESEHVFPSRLTGLEESLLVLAVGLLLFGWQSMLFSLSFMLAVQLFDDCLDVQRDKIAGYSNWAYRFGIVECLLLGGLCVVFAWYVNRVLIVPVITSTVFFYCMLFVKRGQNHDT